MKPMWTRITLLILLLFIPRSAARGVAQMSSAPQSVPASVRSMAAQITEKQLSNHLSFIASDRLAGRSTPSAGLDRAAQYLAAHLKQWGLRPAGQHGSYFHSTPTRMRNVVVPQASTVVMNGRRLKFDSDYLIRSQGGRMNGTFVYAGAGWETGGGAAAINVRGKILVTLDPLGFEFMLKPAARLGAVGLIVVVKSQQEWARLSRGGRNPNWDDDCGRVNLPVLHLNARVAQALFQGERMNLEQLYQAGQTALTFALSPSKRVAAVLSTRCEKSSPRNVVALIEGSHPQLKREYVTLSAHYDHKAVKREGEGDLIYNGADDNGSGTVGLMAIAESIAKARFRPRRSLLFIWHCGEEADCLGARHFAASPTVPLCQMAAFVNADMIGRSKKPGDVNPENEDLTLHDQVYALTSSGELGALVNSVNAAYLKMELINRDPDGYFGRSDQGVYVQKCIPSLLFISGEHGDYHEPSDELEKIDFCKLKRITRTILATAWAIAELSVRPPPLCDCSVSKMPQSCKPPDEPSEKIVTTVKWQRR